MIEAIRKDRKREKDRKRKNRQYFEAFLLGVVFMTFGFECQLYIKSPCMNHIPCYQPHSGPPLGHLKVS